MKIPVKKRKREAGQAILLVILATSIFLLGAVGFAIDGSSLYGQRQMAQAAADAAAQAGIMSIFDGTNTGGAHAFTATSGTTFTCAANAAGTPCYYAQTLNGFNNSATSDSVKYTPNPAGVTFPGLSSDPINVLQVTVSRQVPVTLMALLGASARTVSATGTGAIVNVVSPTPIVVTDPIGSGTLSMNGTTGIKICGGPQRSIQINSSSSTAYGGGGSVDLSHAGPADTLGDCSKGTGADFGVFGGAASNPGVSLGSTGHYISPASPIQDPLASVVAPTAPATVGKTTSVPKGTDGCATNGGCTEYWPGLWTGGIQVKNNDAIFRPGLYYMQGGGFSLKLTTAGMCPVPSSCAADATTGSGMVIYDTGPASGGCDASGGFTIDTNVTATLLGAGVSTVTPPTAPSSPYYGILFFEDRNACAQTHTLGKGNGCFSLIGTIYITNNLAKMKAGIDQTVDYHGTPCSSTVSQGEIIVSDLSMQGNSRINMGIYPTGFLNIRQVALVQ